MFLLYGSNADGLRVSKHVEDYEQDVTTTYYYNGTQLTCMVLSSPDWEEDEVYTFTYDANGRRVSIGAGGTQFVYVYNAQGDVVGLAGENANGDAEMVVTYAYDAWGNTLGVSGSLAGSIGQVNPFRYRSYFYDRETGLYCLQSRYYNPATGRFINADGYVSTGQGFIGNNMFAYCGNNPVNRVDPTGLFWKEIKNFFTKVVTAIANAVKSTFGAGSKTVTTTAKTESYINPILSPPSPITVKVGEKRAIIGPEQGNSSKPISIYFQKDTTDIINNSSAGIIVNTNSFTMTLSYGVNQGVITVSRKDGNIENSCNIHINYSNAMIGFDHEVTRYTMDGTFSDTAYESIDINGRTCAYIVLFGYTGVGLSIWDALQQSPLPQY